VQVYAGKRADGRTRLEYRTVHTSNTAKGKREAENVARALYDEIQARRNTVPPGSLAALADRWLETRDWPSDKVAWNRSLLQRRVVRYLGNRPLHQVTTEDLDTLYLRLRRQGLAPATVRRTHNVVRSMLQQAVKWRYITTNPAHLATLPAGKRARQRPIASPEQARQAIALAEPWLAVLLRLAVHTGARRGELVGLRWSDVDLDRAVIVIEQTKTDTVKALKLGAGTVKILEDWRATVDEQYRAVRGRAMPASWWVFPSAREWGQPVRASSVTHAWTALRGKVGLDGTRLHDLRGGLATTLLNAGVDVRTVQGRGGWANPATILEHYARLMTEADAEAAATMDRWLDE
jgi:integrase